MHKCYCQRPELETNSAVGASAATLMQLRLQHSAADTAPVQHLHALELARHSDDVTASTRATNMKIEELNDCLVTESNIALLKKIKNCTDTPKQKNTLYPSIVKQKQKN